MLFRWVTAFWRSRSFQFDLLTGFFVVIFVTTVSITGYMSYKSSQAFVRFSDRLLKQISQASIAKAVTFLDDTEALVRLSAKLIRNPQDVDIKNENMVDYMMGVIDHYQQISPFYFSSEDGLFFQVRRLKDATYRSQTKLLPANYKYALRHIIRTKEKLEEVWHYHDEDGKRVDSEKISKVLYDPHIRPWYLGAKHKRDIFWTDIYLFSLVREPGISVSYPLTNTKGDFFGVISADITLGKLSSLLHSLRIGEEGIVFITTQTGEVVAHPNVEAMSRTVNGKLELSQVEALDDYVRAAYFHYRKNQEERFSYAYGGKKYIASFTSFPKSFGKDWKVVIVVPESEFVGALQQVQKETLWISLLIFLLSFLFMWILARRLSHPIVELADEAERLRHFQLDGELDVQSNLHEVQLLNTAIVDMRKNLRMFSKFVPKKLVSRLMKQAQELKIGGRRREMTLFFSDIANFTSISEAYSPERLMTHLSEYFDELTKIIIDKDGTVDKYIGDAIMAFWGAPDADRNHHIHACYTALSCQKKLVELNRKWRTEKKPELPTRIGIHTGEVIVGNMGSSERMNYTVLGDNVNLAARLEGVNKMYNTKIMISEAVYENVHKVCLVRPIDVVAVKGKKQGIKIYELVAFKKGYPELLASKVQTEFCKRFTQGFQVYLEQRWDEAIEVFQGLIKQFGEDKAASLLLERAKEFKKTPPPASWDGVVQLKTK